MKKLYVNEEACIGCGACVAIDGTHFDFNDDGLSQVINNENIETEEAKNALSSCPTNAISYVEEKNSETNCNCDNCTCDDCDCDGDECSCPGCGDENKECACEHCNCEK